VGVKSGELGKQGCTEREDAAHLRDETCETPRRGTVAGALWPQPRAW
jgi:hypothetical protein